MVVLMAEGVPINEALVQAYKDPVVKERHLVTPLAIDASLQRPATALVGEVRLSRDQRKKLRAQNFQQNPPKGKGQGKSKKKGKTLQECAGEWLDGKKICYRWTYQS